MSNENKKDFRATLYHLILHAIVFLNFLDLVFTSLFIHHHGPGLEANIIARLIYENWGMIGLIVSKIICTYCFVIPMWWIGYTKKTYFLCHCVLWVMAYITANHIIVFNILEGYEIMPHNFLEPATFYLTN